jgi:hypothetical protein
VKLAAAGNQVVAKARHGGQSAGEAKRLSKLCTGGYLTQLKAELNALQAQRRRKVFLVICWNASGCCI